MRLDADVLILGGGCAGLSLAVALAERAPHLRVHTLEERTGYAKDRTWCFWNTAEHAFAAGVTHRWHSWRVRHAGAEARQHSAALAYQHLPADRFYAIATDTLQQGKQPLDMGVTVREVRDTGQGCEVETDAGVLRSRWVFDSRPECPEETRPVLLQRFVGWHVRTENACFDPSVVDLMDFQPSSQRGRTTFLYVLPFAADEALVEATFLDTPELAPAEGELLLRAYLQRLGGGAYEVLYREAATLPMGEQRRRKQGSEHVVAIGTRGGRVKPSSGYAFQRIQRQSAALAGALAHGQAMPQRVEPRLYEMLDRVFLRALRGRPERAADYFLRLFARVPAEALVRFLSETASPAEIGQVMLALPKLDFLQAAVTPTLAGERAA